MAMGPKEDRQVSDNVHELFKKPLSISNLEKLIEEVKSGEVVSLAIVGTLKNGSITSGYSGADVRPFSLIGGLHVLANHLH